MGIIKSVANVYNISNGQTNMNTEEGRHLGFIFISMFFITSVLVYLAYMFAGIEAALLFAFSWLAAVIATAAVGIENTVNKKQP